MDAEQSDDETVEFEIEVVTSSSSVSSISGNRDVDECEISISNEQTFDADVEREPQKVDCAEEEQVRQAQEPTPSIGIDNHESIAHARPVDQHEFSRELSLDKERGEAEDIKQQYDSTSEKQSRNSENSVSSEPIGNQQLHVGNDDQETIPAEASDTCATRIDDEKLHERLEAPKEANAFHELSESNDDLKFANVCHKVLSDDINLEKLKSLEEQGTESDSSGGTLNVNGEQANEQMTGTHCKVEVDVGTFVRLDTCESGRELPTFVFDEAVKEAPTGEETKYSCEVSVKETTAIGCQLVSENTASPNGWTIVDDPNQLQILSLIKLPNFTTSEAQPISRPDAPDSFNLCDVVQSAHAQTSDVTANTIDQGENSSDDQADLPPDIVLNVKREHVDELKVGLVQNKTVVSIELTDSVHDAPKAPQVIILNDAAHGPANLDSDGHAQISMEPQACDNDDEYDSLGDRDDEEEDLEREFDEEPEFEPRQVVVKRNKDPRDEYVLGSELGRGKFGIVVRCTEQASGRQLAAKFIAMHRREDREDVEREVAIMSVLQHKRLLQLYDAFDDGRQEMCLITELVEGGELFERIVDDDFELTEKKAAIFMRQICEGVDYMHSQQIVHLDMKPENILCLSRTGNRIKLIDFGLARRLNPNKPIRVMFGTPDFAAPEVLGYEMVTLNTDMWSVGVICYVLLSGLSPFMGENDMDTMANVTRATYDFNDQAFEPISELAKDFISKLLLRNPSERLKPSECLKHPWMQKGGAQLEAAVRERRSSTISLQVVGDNMSPPSATALQRHRPSFGGESTTSSGLFSLDKRRLKRYVVKRKWHKTVHAIMALNRMGANLNKLTK